MITRMLHPSPWLKVEVDPSWISSTGRNDWSLESFLKQTVSFFCCHCFMFQLCHGPVSVRRLSFSCQRWRTSLKTPHVHLLCISFHFSVAKVENHSKLPSWSCASQGGEPFKLPSCLLGSLCIRYAFIMLEKLKNSNCHGEAEKLHVVSIFLCSSCHVHVIVWTAPFWAGCVSWWILLHCCSSMLLWRTFGALTLVLDPDTVALLFCLLIAACCACQSLFFPSVFPVVDRHYNCHSLKM